VYSLRVVGPIGRDLGGAFTADEATRKQEQGHMKTDRFLMHASDPVFERIHRVEARKSILRSENPWIQEMKIKV
jgi:hypothetical protein